METTSQCGLGTDPRIVPICGLCSRIPRDASTMTCIPLASRCSHEQAFFKHFKEEAKTFLFESIRAGVWETQSSQRRECSRDIYIFYIRVTNHHDERHCRKLQALTYVFLCVQSCVTLILREPGRSFLFSSSLGLERSFWERCSFVLPRCTVCAQGRDRARAGRSCRVILTLVKS